MQLSPLECIPFIPIKLRDRLTTPTVTLWPQCSNKLAPDCRILPEEAALQLPSSGRRWGNGNFPRADLPATRPYAYATDRLFYMTMASPEIPASVCIPVRNEERLLPACLQALCDAFTDVVVVDSGSTDDTVAIAEAYGARVMQFVWDGRFPKKRNWALRNVEFAHDWVLFLDADEHLTPEFLAELRAVLPVTPHVGFQLSYKNWFMGHELNHGDPFRKIALFRRSAGEYEEFPEKFWSTLDMEIHEHPVLQGSLGQIRARIEHRDYRGLHHYIFKHNEYSTWEAKRFHWFATADAVAWNRISRRQQFKYRNLDKWWLAEVYFWACVVLKFGFLDGKAGWRVATLKRRYFQDVRLKILEHSESALPFEAT
jgi:glycosyltransferase involved in cell wall biosynthesis